MAHSFSSGLLKTFVAIAGLLSAPTGWAQSVTNEQLKEAASDTSSWLMYGRDYSGHRYVGLDQITRPMSIGFIPFGY